MNSIVNDPYLQTARRALKDKEYRKVYERKKKDDKIDSFLGQKISIYKYVNLSESVVNILFLISFLLLPYIVGVSFIFFIIAEANIKTFNKMNIHDYTVCWSIGYEIIALFMLLFIVKSAIKFKLN